MSTNDFCDIGHFSEDYFEFKLPKWREDNKIEKEILTGNINEIKGFCNICNSDTTFYFTKNLRDSGICNNCHATNRDRQVAFCIKNILGVEKKSYIPYKEFSNYKVLQIGRYNKASDIFIKDNVIKTFYNPSLNSGVTYDGVQCEDFTRLSFANNQFDIIISEDTLEHIDKYKMALFESYRILKNGGGHIFTIPFDAYSVLNHRMLFGRPSKNSVWKEINYHYDDDGSKILVYQIFGWQLLIDLALNGFSTSCFFINDEELGIIGSNAIVFYSKKTCE